MRQTGGAFVVRRHVDEPVLINIFNG